MFSRTCIGALLALAALQSCSVKEDRGECPCLLTFDFSASSPREGMAWHVLPLAHAPMSGSFEEADLSGGYVLEVPRDSVKVVVECGTDGTYLPLTGLRVNEGDEFPRLYLSCHDLDTRCECACDTVLLHREHAVLHVYFRGALADGETVEVRGNVCGCEVDGTPVPGPYVVRLDPDPRGLASVCLPRQTDGSLEMAIYDRGSLVRVLRIGEYIVESGYDWSAEDLEDIGLEIDYSLSEIRLSSNMWKRTLTFTIVV